MSEKTGTRDLGDWIGITVALLSVFMAVTKVKDDNIVQAMMQAKSDAVDTWSEYQSKRIKQHLSEMGVTQTQDLVLLASGAAKDTLKAQIGRYAAEVEKYISEEKVIQTKAKGFESLYDSLNVRDDQFDLSDAALSISLGVLGASALTKKRWLLTLSWGFASFGVLMGLAGLLGWTIHPDWLVKLLT